VILLDEVEAWFLAMVGDDPQSAVLVAAALDLLEEVGPTLGRPAVDRIKGSKLHNLKELRPGSGGRSEIRMLFVFDPDRQAVVLTAGDKAGNWRAWYVAQVPLAEERYRRWLAGEYPKTEEESNG
jgi:hypothetical protein